MSFMETVWVEGTLTAQSEIHCGSTTEKTGINQLMHKKKYILSNGVKEKIPVVPGTSIRGILRRLLLRDFFQQLDYQPQTPRIHYLLSGGALENVNAKDSGTINLELRRLIRNKLYPLSLVGGSLGNQAFEGKLKVMNAQLICKELNHMAPVQSETSFREFIQWVGFTRHAERDISEVVEGNMRKGRKGTDEAEPTIQMKVNLECLAMGAQLWHSFCLVDSDGLEKSCFVRLIELWHERPFVGGKSSSGFGRLNLNYPTLKWSSREYLECLKTNREEICGVLSRLDK
jgi:hypothetical protein